MIPAVLITRPQNDSEVFACAVSSLGYKPIIEPLLSVEYRAIDLSSEPKPQALIATSPHAFHAATPADWKTCPVFVMGDASMQRARAEGYLDIISSGGDFQLLIESVNGKLAPGSRVLYLRGENVRHDLKARLDRHHVNEKIVYAMQEKSVLGEPVLQALKSGEIQVITFFSARTAGIFRDLAEAHKLYECLKDIKVLCLSPAVLDSLQSLPWKEAKAACRPDRTGMLAGLQTWIGSFHE
jgi:uroporphyrinogen-III synthase